MANTYGTVMTKVNAGAVTDPGTYNGTLRVITETVAFTSQAIGDTITVAKLPKGATVIYGVLTATATAGATATLAIGIAGTTGKYRTAATFTAANTPTLFGNATALNAALTAEETVIITVAADALPASGALDVTFVYATN